MDTGGEKTFWSLSDFCSPWCVRVVATLRIADHIAGGISQLDDLAKAAGANSEALYCVLRHLASNGMFREVEPRTFTLNEAARFLLDPAIRMSLDLETIGGRIALAWSGILPAVRSGAPAYDSVFGCSFWADLEANPALSEAFDMMMQLTAQNADPDVLIEGQWDSIRTVVDVGGGTGLLLSKILKLHPNLNGILVDLPWVVARSGPVFRSLGVEDRISVSGQSFFDPLPCGADLYVLKSILSNWPDHEATLILKRCAEAAGQNGRISILTGVSPDGAGPAPAVLMFILYGGRNRTLSQFRNLAHCAGLEVVAARAQASGRFIVECRAR